MPIPSVRLLDDQAADVDRPAVSARRILFIHHRPQPSGAVRSLALLIGALGDEWEAHVLVPGGGAAELFEAAGATVHRAPVPAFTHTWDVQYHGLRWLVAVRELMALPAHRRALRRLLAELRPALVHLNDSVLLASAAIAHRAGVPVVWHLRSSLANSGRDRRSRLIASTIDRYAAAAIAIDADVAASYLLRRPIEVVRNPAVAAPGPRRELQVPPDMVSVGFFGYLRRQKGWPEFLEAIRELIDDGVPVHGVVVGGGVRPPRAFRGALGMLLEALGVPDEGTAFAERVTELALERHITHLPFTSDVDGVYRALDMVVFPNQGAGLGRPVLEAAAYGLPVVASGSSAGGGILIPEKTGLLLPQGRPHELAMAIRRLVSDSALRARLGEAARRQTVGAPETARRISAVYNRVLSGRR